MDRLGVGRDDGLTTGTILESMRMPHDVRCLVTSPRRWRVIVAVVLAATAACGGRGPSRTAALPPATGTTSTVTTGVQGISSTAATSPVPVCTSDHGSLIFDEVRADGASIRLAVYLPPCAADGSGRRYPTVYLLHGAGADETQWPAIGLARSADELIAAREIVPLIVVMPSFGLDPADSSIVDDVVPWADANLPTSATRADAPSAVSRPERRQRFGWWPSIQRCSPAWAATARW